MASDNVLELSEPLNMLETDPSFPIMKNVGVALTPKLLNTVFDES